MRKIEQVSESRIRICFSEQVDESAHQKVMSLCRDYANDSRLLDIIPGYGDLLLFYDVKMISGTELIKELEHIEFTNSEIATRKIKIPVCYDEAVGFDLKEVASLHEMTTSEIIQRHTKKTYKVYMLGFMPGFPYLGGLDEQLYTSRRKKPRAIVPAGSVGIGGVQTGIYPYASPGGWQIIGRTPVQLFNPENSSTLLKAGDQIQFYQIDMTTYDMIEAQVSEGTFQVEVTS